MMANMISDLYKLPHSLRPEGLLGSEQAVVYGWYCGQSAHAATAICTKYRLGHELILATD